MVLQTRAVAIYSLGGRQRWWTEGEGAYECSPCTPPSTWADMVLFSNLSSPEYIMELKKKNTVRIHLNPTVSEAGLRGSCNVSDCCCSSPWHPEIPCRGIFSAAHRQRRSTRQGLRWWQQAVTPSSL
uniref:Uncharacterized protein n=1 Tax=Scleropages formosus TaxID=113540 RepID=A0A8C9WLJ4_SCLFO